MSKRSLQIVRHAKSTWDLEEVSDIDRCLKLRGVRAAYEMARRIKIERSMPEQIICSPANRALHTAIIFMRVFDLSFEKLIIDERLYGNGITKVRKVIDEQDSAIKRLMIIGHNPDFSDLTTTFVGNTYIDLPTCGICRIKFEAEKWVDISLENKLETHLDFPKKA